MWRNRCATSSHRREYHANGNGRRATFSALNVTHNNCADAETARNEAVERNGKLPERRAKATKRTAKKNLVILKRRLQRVRRVDVRSKRRTFNQWGPLLAYRVRFIAKTKWPTLSAFSTSDGFLYAPSVGNNQERSRPIGLDLTHSQGEFYLARFFCLFLFFIYVPIVFF